MDSKMAVFAQQVQLVNKYKNTKLKALKGKRFNMVQ